MIPPAPRVVLYTAHGCCLCQELKNQLTPMAEELGFEVEEIDITQDPVLEACYRSSLPVLEVDGRRIVKYRISTPALRQRLRVALGIGRLEGLLRLR